MSKKISEMTAAEFTILTDLFWTVQEGADKKVTLAQLVAGGLAFQYGVKNQASVKVNDDTPALELSLTLTMTRAGVYFLLGRAGMGHGAGGAQAFIQAGSAVLQAPYLNGGLMTDADGFAYAVGQAGGFEQLILISQSASGEMTGDIRALARVTTPGTLGVAWAQYQSNAEETQLNAGSWIAALRVGEVV